MKIPADDVAQLVQPARFQGVVQRDLRGDAVFQMVGVFAFLRHAGNHPLGGTANAGKHVPFCGIGREERILVAVENTLQQSDRVDVVFAADQIFRQP